MKRILYLLFLIALCAPATSAGQNKQKTQTQAKKPAATTQAKKPAATTQNKKPAAATTTQNKKTTTKSKPKTTGKQQKNNDLKVETTKEIRNLEGERAKIQGKINEQQKLLNANRADVAKRLNTLAVINSDIEAHQSNITKISDDITKLEENIEVLNTQLKTLEKQLNDRKKKYARSMQYMRKNGKIQDKLMFIFSAKSMGQMYRRLRFVREYAAYQKAQGDLVKNKQKETEQKREQLQEAIHSKDLLIGQHKTEQQKLEVKQGEQQAMVQSLQKEQKTIQSIIAEQRKQSEELNAKIDKLVAIEIEKAKAKAAAEAKKRAAEAAAEKKRKQEELARKKAAAEAAAKERDRQLAEAKAREAEAKEKARKENANEEQKAAARKATADREAMERKAEAEKRRETTEIAKAKEESEAKTSDFSAEDRKLSSTFAMNRGRLPMPITGSYKIVSHFGVNSVDGLKGVQLDNKGINIQGQTGCQARSIFNGEVSAIFGYGGKMAVMIRHGEYISVYFNLASVSVSKGQKVNTRQTLGVVGSNNILQFQLRKQTTKLNPEQWLGK